LFRLDDERMVLLVQNAGMTVDLRDEAFKKQAQAT